MPATVITDHGASNPVLPINPLTTDISTTETQVGSILLRGESAIVALEVVNQSNGSTSNNLSGFRADVQFYANGPWHSYLDTTDWNSTTLYLILRGNLTNTLAASAKGYSIFRCEAIYQIRFMATAVGPTELQVTWNRRRTMW